MDIRETNEKKIKALSEKIAVYESALHDASCQIEEKVQELSIIKRIGDIAGHIYNLDYFYTSFLDILLEETEAMNCSLMLMDQTSERLIIKVARGRNDDGSFFYYPLEHIYSFALGEGVAGTVAAQRQSILLHDADTDPRFIYRETRFIIGSLLCSPLVFHEKVLGVVNISHTQTGAFSENSKRFIEILSGFVSTLMGNALRHIQDEERFKGMFEGVKFAIMIIDPDTRKIIDCNGYTQTCLGYSKQDLLNTFEVTEIVPEEYRQRLCGILFSNLSSISSTFIEIPFLQHCGTEKMCEINAGTINYLDQDAVRLTLTDISEKKKLSERMLQAEKLKSLGELASGVAHDFNNVLAAIIGRAQLLRMHFDKKALNVAPEIVKSLDVIEKAAHDGSETVRRIQEFSRRHDERKYDTPIDLNKVFDDALEFTRVRWKDMVESEGRGITVVRKSDNLAPVAGNVSELREVFINLINNAVDAMPDGGSLVAETYMDGDTVVSVLGDSGTGISSDIKDKIFDPFFTTKDVGATGLGLSVSYGIINRHNGKINVESTEGKGTRFSIRLPACGDAVKGEPEEVPVKKAEKGSVLVVEDKENVRQTICDIITFSGSSVDSADNGITGLQKFKDAAYDVVITDLGMPGMSGFELAKAIKKISADTPVVLVTGWELRMTDQELRENGIDYLITKPFRMKHLLHVVRTALSTSTD